MPTSPALLYESWALLPFVTLLGIALLSSITLYTIAVLLYNAFFHPLRKFPGPMLAGATNLTAQVQSCRGRFHLWIHELHQQYGPIIRYGPNKLSSIDPATWKEVYGHHAPQWPKDYYFFGPDPFGKPPGIFRADDVAHARQRKLVSHAFSDKALREQEHIIKSYVSLLVNKVHQEASKHSGKVNLVAWFNFTTFDIMADLTFGESLQQLAGSMYSPWVKSIFSFIRYAHLSSIFMEWRPLDKPLALLIPAKFKNERRLVTGFAADKVKRRLQMKVDRPDIWSYILRYRDDEANQNKGLLPTEMLSNGNSFMLAGTETTATLLNGLMYYLLRDKKRYERLAKDIRDAFPTYEDMTMVSLMEQKYLQACLEEGLRLYPPVPTGIPRCAPENESRLGDHIVPKGTRVQVSQYAANHSPRNFKDPELFIPERWLPEGQAEYGWDKRDVVQPFSYGPRNCLGKNLAYHEMRLIAASLLWHFDFELSAESRNWINQPVYFFWDKPPLNVWLKPVAR